MLNIALQNSSQPILVTNSKVPGEGYTIMGAHYSKLVIAEKLNFLLKWRFSTITITGPFESGGVSVDGKSLWKSKGLEIKSNYFKTY